MRILVAVKRVADFNARIRVNAEGTGVDLSNVKMAMNPFDEIAVEAALRLREAGAASEVVVVSVGEASVSEAVRAAFAMGADRGIVVRADGRVEPLAVAKILAAIAKREEAGLVILGKQAIDDDANQTGQMLAALAGWPIATFASEITIDGAALTVTREIDGGHETLRMAMPAVVTADLRLNQPRYASLPNIMKAKKKPIDEMTVGDLGIDTAPRLRVLKVAPPADRKAGVKVSSATELVERLRAETGVL
ncbi:MAG TPA: electron transfer flavoprotein subunit beta/FixA family protein [Bauldia sp.]|nr:electron transfer flavoprotein subunit beta/FixA family protein [Bauldia sp.]